MIAGAAAPGLVDFFNQTPSGGPLEHANPLRGRAACGPLVEKGDSPFSTSGVGSGGGSERAFARKITRQKGPGKPGPLIGVRLFCSGVDFFGQRALFSCGSILMQNTLGNSLIQTNHSGSIRLLNAGALLNGAVKLFELRFHSCFCSAVSRVFRGVDQNALFRRFYIRQNHDLLTSDIHSIDHFNISRR